MVSVVTEWYQVAVTVNDAKVLKRYLAGYDNCLDHLWSAFNEREILTNKDFKVTKLS